MRRYQAVLLAVTALVVASIAAYLLYGTGGRQGGQGTALVGGPFTLVDQDGKPRTEKDFRGQFMLIYFGYTYCPDVCPTSLQTMTQAMDRLDSALQAKITPVFVTIDPARDTAPQLKAYVENFHPRMIALTGSEKQIADAARVYRIYYAKAEGNDTTTDYLMDHSSIVFLMGPDGGYVTHFTHTTPPDKMAETLQRIVGGG